MQVKDTLTKHCTIQIQKGDSSIWSTPWCSVWKEIHNYINLPVTVPNLPQSMSELWIPGTKNWNDELISHIFYVNAASAISQIIVVPADSMDAVKWKSNPKGNYSAKEAFKLLNAQVQVQLPTQGARGVGHHAMEILARVWAHKLLRPNIKTFVWRLIRRAIARGARAGNLSSKISRYCDTCNMLENDSHLFFHCSFARAVWFSAKTPLRTSLLPLE
jgi:hypothetical protein